MSLKSNISEDDYILIRTLEKFKIIDELLDIPYYDVFKEKEIISYDELKKLKAIVYNTISTLFNNINIKEKK